MGRATRDALNARRTQHGTQSTRDAVNVGRCQRGTLSTQAAVKGDGCQGRGDITVGNHHFKIQMGISFRLWTQGLVIVRWALIMQLKATTIVSLTMQPHYLYSATFRPQLVQICLENVFHRWANLKITVSGGDFVIFLAYILCLPIFRELCWLYGYKFSTFYPSLLISQNIARKKGWEPHLKVPFPIEIDKVGCGVTSSPCGHQFC